VTPILEHRVRLWRQAQSRIVEQRRTLRTARERLPADLRRRVPDKLLIAGFSVPELRLIMATPAIARYDLPRTSKGGEGTKGR
jgi:hypothetical protein